jgi:sarcosine oxidase, subunit beta
MQQFDVVVIGGGVEGSSIAYNLARAGRSVLVVERSTPAAEPSASWASAGGVRQQGRDSREVALAVEAIRRWATLEEELEADLHYRRDGNLKLTESEATAATLADDVASQQAAGLADIRLVDRAEIRELIPTIADSVVAGTFTPSDGHADPRVTTGAFAAAAQRHGATYWNGTVAHRILVERDKVTGLETSRGNLAAGSVVLAAGWWSDELARGVGIVLPIQTRPLQMLLTTQARPGLLRPVLGSYERSLSLKQLPDGRFFIGGGWPGDANPARDGCVVREESVAGSWATATEVLPAVAEQRIERQWCGLEAFSIDGVPFVGRAPGVEGLFLAVGFTGHGFALSPAVGRVIADQIAGRATPEAAGLDPSRIDGFDAAAMEAFVAEAGTPEAPSHAG